MKNRFSRSMSYALLVAAALLLQTFAHAQKYIPTSNDSLTFINANWGTVSYDRGITLKQFHFKGDNQLFESNQFVSIIEINTKKVRRGYFALASDQGKITKTSKFAKDSGAVVAINGTFYNMRPDYNCVCYFKKNGKEEFAYSEKMEQRDNGAIAISNKGRIVIIPADSENPGETKPQGWAETIEAPSVMCSGPMLLYQGKNAILKENAFNVNRHPRSAIAIKGKKVYLIAVDGRSADSQGVSLWEFTAIMRYLGVDDALNLDGGGSTTLYYDGLSYNVKDDSQNGIVNHPSDNKKFDREGERSVVNALLFIKR